MAYLEKIRLKGFKSIRELDLPLRPLNVLVGANGSGKSNLLAAFRLLNAIADRRLQAYTQQAGAESFLYFGQKVTPQIKIRLRFGTSKNAGDGNRYDATLIPSQMNTLIFEDEKWWYLNQGPHPGSYRQLGDGHSETLLHDRITQRGDNIARYVLAGLTSWKLYHFHDTTSTAGVKLPGLIGDAERLRPDASNLAAFLYGMREQQRPYYDRIVSTIQMVVPFFEDFVLRPYPPKPDSIELGWRHKESDAYFNTHALSDGSLGFEKI